MIQCLSNIIISITSLRLIQCHSNTIASITSLNIITSLNLIQCLFISSLILLIEEVHSAMLCNEEIEDDSKRQRDNRDRETIETEG